MEWDARRRVYVRPDDSIVSPAELRQLIEDYIEREKVEIDDQAQLLIAGTITAVFFFDWLRDKIKEVHGAAGLVAYGGESEMNHERWTRIGEKVTTETAYVAGFEQEFLASEKIAEELVAEAVSLLEFSGTSLSSETISAIEDLIRSTAPASDIPIVAETLAEQIAVDAAEVKAVFTEVSTAERIGQLIFGQTPVRSQLYMEAVYGTHENSTKEREADAGVTLGRRVSEEDQASCDGCIQAATEEYVPLDEILDIGEAECMSNCRCVVEFSYEGVEPLNIERSIYAPGFA